MISEKPWRAELVLQTFLGIVMTICFGTVLAGVLVSEKVGIKVDYRDFTGMMVMALAMQGGFIFWIWFLLRQTPMSWHDAFGLGGPGIGKTILWGMVGALIAIPVVVGLQALISDWTEIMTKHEAVSQQVVVTLQKANLPLVEQIFIPVWAILVAPPAEEMLFRGLFYPIVKQAGFPRIARWSTSLLFAALHVNWLSFLPLAVFSLILIDLYEKTGSLWAPITAHGLFNLTNWLMLELSKGDHPVLHIR